MDGTTRLPWRVLTTKLEIWLELSCGAMATSRTLPAVRAGVVDNRRANQFGECKRGHCTHYIRCAWNCFADLLRSRLGEFARRDRLDSGARFAQARCSSAKLKVWLYSFAKQFFSIWTEYWLIRPPARVASGRAGRRSRGSTRSAWCSWPTDGPPSRPFAWSLRTWMHSSRPAKIEEREVNDVDGLKALPGARELLTSLPPERYAIVTSGSRRLASGATAGCRFARSREDDYRRRYHPRQARS